jgi:hypothetical protein
MTEIRVPSLKRLLGPAVSASEKHMAKDLRGALVELSASGGVRATGTDLGVWAGALVGQVDDESIWSGFVPREVALVEGAAVLRPVEDLLEVEVEGGLIYRIRGEDASEFPPTPEGELGEGVLVPRGLTGLRKVLAAVSRDKVNPTLGNVLLDRGWAVGTDGFLLCAALVDGPEELSGLVPLRAAEVMLASLEGEGFWLQQGEGLVDVAGVDFGWVVGRVEEQVESFPDWAAFIQRKAGGGSVVLNGEAVLRAVSGVTVVSARAKPRIKLSVEKGGLRLELAGEGSMGRESGVTLKGEGTGSGSCEVEASLLRVAVEGAGSGAISVSFGSDDRPVQVESGGADYHAVLSLWKGDE